MLRTSATTVAILPARSSTAMPQDSSRSFVAKGKIMEQVSATVWMPLRLCRRLAIRGPTPFHVLPQIAESSRIRRISPEDHAFALT